MRGALAGFASSRLLPVRRADAAALRPAVVASATRPPARTRAHIGLGLGPVPRPLRTRPLARAPPSPPRAPDRLPGHVRAPARRETRPPVREVPIVPVRKPNGYWNELANVERALIEVNLLLPGRAGKKVMPSTPELKFLGRNDLLAALAKHQGMKKVAALLGWTTARRRSKTTGVVVTPRRTRTAKAEGTDLEAVVGAALAAPSSPASVSAVDSRMLSPLSGSLLAHAVGVTQTKAAPKRVFSTMRASIPRRPKHYWDDLEKVMSSISAFIAEYGTPGIMPTGREFADAGHGALRQAAQRHGGLVKVAACMGLKARKAPKKKNTWSDREYFLDALRAYVEQHDPGVMPTASELKAAGESQLANAVTSHGGYPAVARELGLIVRNSRKEGAPEVWDRETLVAQLQTFTATFYPSLALANRLPSESQLRRCGRNDLCYAVTKFGGYKRVQESLGFAPRPVGPRVSANIVRRMSRRQPDGQVTCG